MPASATAKPLTVGGGSLKRLLMVDDVGVAARLRQPCVHLLVLAVAGELGYDLLAKSSSVTGLPGIRGAGGGWRPSDRSTPESSSMVT